MNIEVTVIAYLADVFPEIPVYAERPMTPPPTYLLVDKTGAELVNFINQSTVIVESIAPSKYDASLLNNSVKAAMMAIADDDKEISMCSLESDYDDTDTALKDYRYTAVFNISHY